MLNGTARQYWQLAVATGTLDTLVVLSSIGGALGAMYPASFGGDPHLMGPVQGLASGVVGGVTILAIAGAWFGAWLFTVDKRARVSRELYAAGAGNAVFLSGQCRVFLAALGSALLGASAAGLGIGTGAGLRYSHGIGTSPSWMAMVGAAALSFYLVVLTTGLAVATGRCTEALLGVMGSVTLFLALLPLSSEHGLIREFLGRTPVGAAWRQIFHAQGSRFSVPIGQGEATAWMLLYALTLLGLALYRSLRRPLA